MPCHRSPGAAHLVRDLQLFQRRLKSKTHGAGAIEDGDLLRGMAALDQPLDRSRHLPRLDVRSTIPTDGNLAGAVDNRLIVLVAPDAVFGDQSLGCADDLRCRAIIAVQHMNLRARVSPWKVNDEPHVGSPKGVERLVVIADHPQVRARFHEVIEQPNLSGVDVLIFVDEHMVVRAGDRRRIGGIPIHCPHHQRHHVGEVDGAGGAKGFLVDLEEINRVAENLVIADLRGEARGVQEALLRPRR